MNLISMEFLINTYSHWEEPPRARHQVAHALARNHSVVFVAANRVGFPRMKTYEDHKNLQVVQPYFFVGNKVRYRLPLINELYQRWLFRRLKKRYKAHRVINFDFTATQIYCFFKEVVFYYNDNLAAISKRLNPGIIARYHRRSEAIVAAKAHFCVSVTPILRKKLQEFNPRSYEIPLGGPDMDDLGVRVNGPVSKTMPIKVGLVGFISSYSISADIINHVLRQEKMEMIVIGPVEASFMEQLEHPSRLVLKGTLTGKELYREISGFDVAIAPYCEAITKDDQVGVGTGSKMYQYLALGKPVVITDMVGLKEVTLPENFLYIAQNGADFPVLIKKAFEEDSEAAKRERAAFARENTWEKRMENLIEFYHKS